tara:strand:- start:460 stop:807 length:348 start_codon:yes stop_codon:yes gene_type:complete
MKKMEEQLSDEDDDACSTDSVDVNVIEERIEDDPITYRCRTVTGDVVELDRSDLIDGSKHQRLVMDFEKRNPPPWDEVCMFCEGEGCEECECEECGRPMRHINGTNYGCVKHPVI